MQFRVTGMTCAACSARVEKAASAVPGVEKCVVNLLTNSLEVSGNVSAQQIIQAVQNAGYGAYVDDTPKSKQTIPEDNTARLLKKQLLTSLCFLVALLYLSMGHTMLGLPLPSFMTDNPVLIGLAQMILAVVIMVINRHFYVNGVKSLLHKSPNMDTLVALGSSAAFIYSTYVLVRMALGDNTAGLHDLYFESAAMILGLITFGKMLEARSKGRTTDALRGLMELAPRIATVLVDGEERVIPAEQVAVDTVFLVRPGDVVPVDGVVLEGNSAINEAALTGESIPVDKGIGDTVSAATLNQSGYLKCRATRVGEETTLSQIIQMVEQTASTKAPIAKLADKVAGVFVPVVSGIALVTFIVWLLLDAGVGFAMARAISVLVISCPCALSLATPMAIMVGSGIGARNGVLFKTAAAMEQAGRIRIVALDKTGTITAGKPQVTDVIAVSNRETLLQAAYSLEQHSEHPLGMAVRQYGQEQGVAAKEVTEFRALPGNGLIAQMDEVTLLGGSDAFIRQHITVPSELERTAENLAQEGKTPLFFAKGEALLGVIAVADTIKPDSPQAIRQLKEMGIRVVMLTGDNRRTAAAIGRQAGVDEVVAEVMPQDKEREIRRLMEQGPTAMVGDGINDAPALMAADVGIAIGAGTDIAIDAADVVLMHSRLSDVPAALRLGRATLRKIRTNLFWAFAYNTLGIPLAAGVFIPIGLELNPMFGALAMCLSSFCVMTNTLRLNLFKMHRDAHTNGESCCCEEHHHHYHDHHNHECCKEETTMEKVIKVEGMMCAHCEAHVKAALEEIPGVESAVADRMTGTATVTLSDPVNDPVLRAAIEAKGYKTLD